MALQRQNPSAKLQGTQGPKDAQSYLQDLENLLKRNTGSSTMVGQETSSNIPMYLPGRPVTGQAYSSETPTQGTAQSQAPAGVVRDYQDFPQFNDNESQDIPTDVQGFLESFSQSVYRPQQPSSEQAQYLYEQAGIPYAIQSMADGGIRMNTGEIIYSTQETSSEEAYPKASMMDGSVLWSDGYTRQAPSGMSGVEALSQALFGGQQTVTQQYGNYNPGMYGAGRSHQGTDFRTRDLQDKNQYMPVDGTVVQRLDNHPMYGNSVLIQLPTGEMMRLSHFSQLGDFGEGDTIPSGSLLGVYGSTGNSTGEHLDVELYSPEGQLIDPTQFRAFSDPSVYGGRGEITGIDPYATPATPVTQPQQAPQQQVQQPQQMPSPIREAVSGSVTRANNAAESIMNSPKQIGSLLGSQPVQRGATQAGNMIAPTIDRLNPTGTFDAGITEGAITPQAAQTRLDTVKQSQPSTGVFGKLRQSAGNLTEAVGDTLGIPEGSTSELIAGGPTRRTNQAMASEINKAQGSQPGQSLGVLDSLKDVGQDVNQFTNEKLSQAGEGIKSLAQSGVSQLQSVFAPKQTQEKRAVGDVAGTATGTDPITRSSSVMDSAPSMANFSPMSKVQDQFFRSGADKNYSDYLPDNASQKYGGALSLDLFSDKFFQNEGNISDVFGGSSLYAPAQGKFEAYQAEQRRIEEERRARENKSRPSLEDYLRMGKTKAQYYAETGQQSVADAAGGYEKAANAYFDKKADAYRQNKPSPNASQDINQLRSNAVSAAITAAGQGKPYYSSTGNRIYNYTPVAANMTDAGTGLPTIGTSYKKPQSSPNVFSRASTSIQSIFRR